MARKSKLNLYRTGQIVRLIRRGVPIKTACLSAGISYNTYNKWMRAGADGTGSAEHRRFYEAVTRAQEDCERELSEQWFNRAVRGSEKRTTTTVVYSDGSTETSESVEKTDGDWRAIAEFLRRRFPDRWSKRESIEVSGPGGGPIELQPVPVDRLSLETRRRILSELEAVAESDDELEIELTEDEYELLSGQVAVEEVISDVIGDDISDDNTKGAAAGSPVTGSPSSPAVGRKLASPPTAAGWSKSKLRSEIRKRSRRSKRLGSQSKRRSS